MKKRYVGEERLLELDRLIKSAAAETLTETSVGRFGLYQAVITDQYGQDFLVTVEKGVGELESITPERARTLATEPPRKRGRW